MRKLFKYFVTATYKPILSRYLSKPRNYYYKGINLVISPEVFHPGFFFSTKLLLKFINRADVKQKTFLELGAGSGLISMCAAKKGANVTATDINPVAVEYLEKNAKANNVCINVIHSDLFQKIPLHHFDFIAVNPPFFKKAPKTYKDYAWYCGENGEYFSNLFGSLAGYINANSTVLMILSDGCDFEMINAIASRNMFRLDCVYTKQNWLETNFIYRINGQR